MVAPTWEADHRRAQPRSGVVRPISGFIRPGNLRSTASDSETLQPSGNGWSIANAAVYQQGNWLDEPGSHTMKVELEAVAR